MSGRVTEGQARLAPIAGAVVALLRGDDVDVDALLPAWRALSPACHPLAGGDVVDVAALTRVLARRPGLLVGGATPVVVDAIDDDPRGGRADAAVARALADALVVRLESRKIAYGLTAPAPALRAAFADPETARQTLSAVRDLAGIAIAAPTTTTSPAALVGALGPLLDAAGGPRALHVVVGARVRRLFDLLSPYCRRLRVDLALAGRAAGGVPDDDDVYRGLDRLLAAAPATVVERRRADAAEGFVDSGAGFVVDAARLVEDLVDRRARGLVAALKRARAVVVGVIDERMVDALDAVPASTRVLVPGAGGSCGALVDGASGAVLPLHDVEEGAPSLSVSTSALAPVTPGLAVDEGGFAAAQALWRRRIDDPRWPVPGVTVDDDVTRAALQALAAMVPAAPRR
jgi:hypothetical protein